MRIGFEAALGPHADALELRGRRTEVLARNIANADTPGYLARDVDFRAELTRRLGEGDQEMTSTTIRRTDPRHLPTPASDTVTLKYRNPLMASFDGNTVNTQTEQASFAENNMQFQAALRFLNGRFQGLMSAIKGE